MGLLSKRFSSYLTKIRRLSHSNQLETGKIANYPQYLQFHEKLEVEKSLAQALADSMTLHYDFLSENEELSILEEIEPYMNRLRYETDHFDDAIHNYRETERLKWTEANNKILDRVRAIAFPPSVGQLEHVHILDLHPQGFIKPHIDAIRFCGDTIAGLSLLSDSVMRLVHDKRKDLYADVFLKRRSLYIMKGSARYDYTHEILKNEISFFRGNKIEKTRRISVICRNEPSPEDKK